MIGGTNKKNGTAKAQRYKKAAYRAVRRRIGNRPGALRQPWVRTMVFVFLLTVKMDKLSRGRSDPARVVFKMLFFQ